MSSIREYVMQHPLFCTHNHHFGFEDFDAERSVFSFKHLLDLSANLDMITAGGAEAKLSSLTSDLIRQLWPMIRAAGSGRAAILACHALFAQEFSPSEFETITRSMMKLIDGKSADVVYDYLVREKAQNIWTINDHPKWKLSDGGALNLDQYPATYWFTFRMDSLFHIRDSSPFEELEVFSGQSISSLSDFAAGLNAALDRYKASGRLAAIKIPMAYYCDLGQPDPSPEQAERAFSRLRSIENNKTHEGQKEEDWEGIWKTVAANPDSQIMAGYALHRLLKYAQDVDLPVQIHTGFLAGHWMPLEHTRVTKLIPIFDRYRRVRFDILHASWPWTSELAAIAKNSPNIWLDMAWAWIVNPEASVRTLSEWLDCLPFNKIHAFGADTMWPWISPGLSLQAKQGIARALEHKISEGYIDLALAEDVATQIMLKNAEDFFGVN